MTEKQNCNKIIKYYKCIRYPMYFYIIISKWNELKKEKKGYYQVTMKMVSQEAGISVGTLYNYYQHKQELFLIQRDFPTCKDGDEGFFPVSFGHYSIEQEV